MCWWWMGWSGLRRIEGLEKGKQIPSLRYGMTNRCGDTVYGLGGMMGGDAGSDFANDELLKQVGDRG